MVPSSAIWVLTFVSLCFACLNWWESSSRSMDEEYVSSRSMDEQYVKKITWTIKNFSSLTSGEICSDQFVVGGCKWFLRVYPYGKEFGNYLSLYLEVADNESLPSGWRRNTRYSLTIVNQYYEERSKREGSKEWFSENYVGWGRKSMVLVNDIHAPSSGFLVNGELKIVAEIEVLEVIGKLDLTKETSTIMETVDVKGFQLLPSQVDSVRRIFEKHPDIASEFRPKKPNLRTAYMGLLLSLIENMCFSPEEISQDDLFDAYAALGSMKNAGFKLDWLEKKLNEVSEKKKKLEGGDTRMMEIEEELKDLKHKCSDLEAQLEKEKAEVLAAKIRNSFDEVV